MRGSPGLLGDEVWGHITPDQVTEAMIDQVLLMTPAAHLTCRFDPLAWDLHNEEPAGRHAADSVQLYHLLLDTRSTGFPSCHPKDVRWFPTRDLFRKVAVRESGGEQVYYLYESRMY